MTGEAPKLRLTTTLLRYTLFIYITFERTDMVRTQIYITEDERTALQALAHQSGKSQSELIRQAIHLMLETKQETDRNAVLQAAKGMWKDRDDLPDLRQLREESNRY
jgi:hypothetical protein